MGGGEVEGSRKGGHGAYHFCGEVADRRIVSTRSRPSSLHHVCKKSFSPVSASYIGGMPTGGKGDRILVSHRPTGPRTGRGGRKK